MYCFKKMRTFSRFLELIYDSAFELGYQRHQNSVFIWEAQYYVTSVLVRYKLNMILFSILSVLFEMSRIGRSRKNVRAHFLRNFSRKNGSQEILWDTLYTCKYRNKNSKNDKLDFQQNSTLRKRKGKGGPRKVRKFRNGNKNFSCYVKRLSNKYRKNSKIDKFNKILDLQAEKAKKGLEKSANFATENRKSNKNFSRYL